jgi:hypothetical protein
MHLGRVSFAAIALSAVISTGASAAPILGGYAVTYADADFANAPPGTSNGVYSANGALISATADQGPGARTSVKSQSDAWVNRIDINSAATDTRAIVIGSAMSLFAVNQRLTGDPGSTATISYTIGIDGSFAPGNNLHYPPPQFAAAQNFIYYLLPYSGRALSTTVVTDQFGTYIDFVSTNGRTSIGRSNIDENAPFRIGGLAACFGADTRCSQGGVFNDTRTTTFNIGVDQDFFILGFLASQTNGNTDFFNTAKLQTIGLAPQFGLISEDGGALQRSANGSFRLPVPEPSSWAMMIIGFGIVGGSMRRQTTRRAATA